MAAASTFDCKLNVQANQDFIDLFVQEMLTSVASKAAADAAASDKAPAANNQQSSLGGFSDDDLNDEF